MDGLVGAVILALIVVPIIRFFVWRNRYEKMQEHLARLEHEVGSIKAWMRRLQSAQEPSPAEPGKRISRKTAVVAAPSKTTVAERKTATVAEPETAAAREEITPKIAAKSTIDVKRTEPLPPDSTERKKTPEPARVAEAARKPHSTEERFRHHVSQAPGATGAYSTWKNRAERLVSPVPESPPRSRLAFLKNIFWRLAGGRPEQSADWETIIGRHWLSLVGIVVLVVGIALLTQQTLLYLGPAGKIATGAAVGLLLIAGGILLGRSPNYRLLAWTILGGGWAILYFTAYAAYNVEQAKLIQDPVTALACLFVVAAGMIGHSLVYRSQLLTGLAYGLAVFAITISPISLYSLVASLVLAASLVVLLRVFAWYHLAAAGVVGTYLNHLRWLEEAPSTLVQGRAIAPSQGFWFSIAILVGYWLIFVISAFVRRPEAQRDRDMHFAINAINTVGMLGLMSRQIWEYQHGQLYYLTAPACIAYALVGYLNRTMKFRELFLFNATVAIGLFAVSLPLAISELAFISSNWLALYWVVGALAVLFVGAKLGELLIRVEAYVLFAAASFAAWQFNLGGELTLQSPLFWPVVPAIIVILTGVGDWLQKVKDQPGIFPAASELSWVFTGTAALLLALFVWRLADRDEAGLFWLVAGLGAFSLGLASHRHLIRAQGYFLSGLGILAVFLINLQFANERPPLDGMTIAVWTAPNWALCATAAAILYFWGWQMRRHSGRLMDLERVHQYLPSSAATAILALLVFRELDWGFMAAAWMLLALVLFAVGQRFDIFHLRLQSFALSGLAFAAALLVNILALQPETEPPSISLRPGDNWTLAAFVALGLAGQFAWIRRYQGVTASGAQLAHGLSASYAAVLLFSLVLWKIFDLAVVPGAWIVFALILFAIGLRLKMFHVRVQSYLLSSAAFCVALAVDIYGEGGGMLPVATGGWFVPGWLIASLVSVGLGYQYFQIRRTDMSGHILETQFAFVASYAFVFLVALIFWRELPSAGVAGAWTLLGLVLFEISGKYGLGNLRSHAHMMMLAAFARVLMANYTIDTEAFGISHRLLTVVPIIAACYYLRYRSLDEANQLPSTGDRLVDRYYSYAGAILLVALLRFELGRAYAVLGWAAMFPILYWLGRRREDLDFRLQSYVIAVLAFARSWSTSVFLIGEIFGMPERLVTTAPVIAALLATTFLAPQTPIQVSTGGGYAAAFDTRARKLFAFLASVLIPVLIFYQLSIDYVSIGWAIAGLGLIALGFSTGERTFRLCGLALLFVTLGKVVIFDLAGVETIYRIVSFIVLGVILLLASLGYTRYRSLVERYV